MLDICQPLRCTLQSLWPVRLYTCMTDSIVRYLFSRTEREPLQLLSPPATYFFRLLFVLLLTIGSALAMTVGVATQANLRGSSLQVGGGLFHLPEVHICRST